MKGLIPAGGDVGDAVEELLRSDDDEILIPVPGAALLSSGGANGFVAWLPLNELAQAIQGLIEARRSEEHTSELPSLMRISYAVFCLKKKTTCTTLTSICSITLQHAYK